MIFNILQFIPGGYAGWSLGSNNAANVFGPQVYAGIIRYRLAVLLTALFIIIGALIEGNKCFATLEGITPLIEKTAIISLFVAAVFVHLMSYLKLPVSTSQTIVGALAGIGFLEKPGLNYDKLAEIFISWVLTPVGAAIIAYLLYKFFAFVWQSRIRNIVIFNRIVRIGSILIGCYAAYSLGANNLANTTGPYVAAGMLTPFGACLVGGAAIASGVLTYSKNVMYTVGKKITALDPFSALIAVFSVAITLHIYTQIRIPVSSSQAIVGGVIGVGLVKGTRTVSKRTLYFIFVGWIFSVLGAGALAYGLGWVINRLV